MVRFFIFVLFFASTLEVGETVFARDGAEPQRGNVRMHRFEQDGLRRRFLLYTPKGAAQFDTPRPLVLVFHGAGGTDREMMALTKRRWHELADEHGIYVAYPNAVKKTWDFGGGKIAGKLRRRVDDLAYFIAVIDRVSAGGRVDPTRVFATGFSRGGQASYFLACKAPDRVRAIMPVATGLPDYMEDACSAAPPKPVSAMNGTDDPLSPYEGGTVTVLNQERDVVLSAEDSIALWADKNGCKSSDPISKVIDLPGDKTSVEYFIWPECDHEPVQFFKVNNGGHTWAGGKQYGPAGFIGHTSKDVNASDEAWKFFSKF